MISSDSLFLFAQMRKTCELSRGGARLQYVNIDTIGGIYEKVGFSDICNGIDTWRRRI